MKKILLSAILVAMCSVVSAQPKKAPNYYRAVPGVHTNRLLQWSTYGGSKTYDYKYDEYGYLKEVQAKEESKLVARYTYEYDKNGYLKEESHYIVAPDGEEKHDRRDVYDRDDNGFIKTYHRFTLKSAENEQPTLKEDVRSTYEYDNQMRVTKTNDIQFDEAKQKLEDIVARNTIISYDEKGRESTFSYLMANGNEVWKEEFEYDEDNENRMVGLKYIPGEESTDNETIEWVFGYNDEGDITTAGRESFPYTYEYGDEDETKYETAKTFIPLPQSEGDKLYLGPRNCMYFNHLPLNKAYTHVPLRENSEGNECSYEENTAKEKTINGIATVNQIKPTISFNNNKLIVSNVLANCIVTLNIYTVAGQIVATHHVEGNKVISLDTLPAGQYIVKAGGKVTKIVKL